MSECVGERHNAEDSQRPHHHYSPAKPVPQQSCNQCPNQEADVGTACQQADLETAQRPLGTNDREDECDYPCIHGFKGKPRPPITSSVK